MQSICKNNHWKNKIAYSQTHKHCGCYRWVGIGCAKVQKLSNKTKARRASISIKTKCKVFLNWRLERACANLSYPFPTLVLYQVFAGVSRDYGKFMTIFCVF